ncbi:cell division protein FtsW [Duganella sp. SG902]|uniref:FtsW/RodA/SpoVE family cell cycle protein n=1 Tax=Duganella sp. SG902 TaxID=2587016 RepID=UPI0017B496DE|nr:FtsW/RodA/SpoVE family cell cycle protein [Duganella sp. SG902]NVM78594.1 cell division protein FtsW [Duganella sp. SG902]
MMRTSASRVAPHPAGSLTANLAEGLASLLRAGRRAALRHSGMACTLALLAVLSGLQALALLRAPAAWLPSAITVNLAAGNVVTLGQRELAAPQTDRNHLSLRRNAEGRWFLRNLSASRPAVLLRDTHEQRLGSADLQGVRRFQIDGAVFDMRAADARSVRFTRDGREWRYDGAVLYRDGRQQASCPDARISGKLLAAWNRVMPQPLTIARPLSFGGNLYCDNRLGLAQVTPGAAQVARIDGRLQLSAGNPDGDRAAVLVEQADLRKQEAALDGVNAIMIGRTRLQLSINGEQLTLHPGRHVTLYSEPELKLPEHIRWEWQQRALFSGGPTGTVLAVLALSLVCVGVAALIPSARAARLAEAAAGLASAGMLAAGVTALVAQRTGYPPSAACSLLLGAGALLLWLALPEPGPRRLTLATATGAILLAAGLLAQLELGLGALESSWLRYYQKSAAMLAIGAGLGALLRTWAHHHAARGGQLQQRTIEWILALFAAAALAALAAQVLWGDETGVFDLQPVELAKLALTALAAHCLALRFNWHNGPQRLADHGARWLRLIAPALLFLALLGLALVQVDDFSPLILLLVWSTGMGLAYAVAARNRPLAAFLLGGAMLAAGGVIYLRLAGTDDLIRWGFYADRFLVWLNPAEHPHTGQQLLLGARAIGDGGWFGADHWLGLRTLGQVAGEVVRIPAVQDDFAASFFLNRHGLLGGLLLWAVQAAFLIGLLLCALRAYRHGAAARNFRQAWLGRFRYFALCGGGAFVLGHFLLSWGTNLAIFPIMGQPMSFLSAGGSHLLFFLCPLLTFSAISSEGV